MLRKLGNFSVFLLVCVLFISMCDKREQFTINGNVEGISDSTKLYLLDRDDNEVYDSAMVIDNKFQFKGSVNRPKPFSLYSKNDRRDNITLWVENVDIQISGTSDKLKEAKITGSEVQEQADFLSAKLKPIRDKSRAVMEKMKSLSKTEKNAEERIQNLKEKRDSLTQKDRKIRRTYISNHPKSIISAFNLSFLMRSIDDKNKVEELYNNLNKNIQTSVYGQKVKKYLNLRRDLNPGDKAIDFTLPNMKGDSVSLSDYKGEYVLLDFWASWCGGCRQYNEMLLKNYKKYKNKDFNILSVSIDENREDWVNAVEEDSLLWNNVSSLNGIDGKVAMTYDIYGVPTSYLIDPEGEIIAKDHVGKEIIPQLKEIFANGSKK